MKIHEDVLSPELLEICLEELKSYQESQVWGISTCIWVEALQEGVVGNVSMRFLPEKTSILVNESLKKYFPPFHQYRMMYQYYIWNKMAGISSHDDASYHFGGTLYLNKTWDANWGGLYVWKDKDEEKEYKLNALCPKQNMLVINDEREMHSVTSIAPTTPYPRITIQIWGANKT
jgi:hypothetical protein